MIEDDLPSPIVIDDDPDTSWGLWEAAVAEQDRAFLSTEPMPLETYDIEPTTPIPLEESLEDRKTSAYNIIANQYTRIAETIRIQWGYKECEEYISKLVMDSSDRGISRMGFDQSIITALIVLSEIHTQQFGSFVSDTDFGTNSVWAKL